MSSSLWNRFTGMLGFGDTAAPTPLKPGDYNWWTGGMDKQGNIVKGNLGTVADIGLGLGQLGLGWQGLQATKDNWADQLNFAKQQYADQKTTYLKDVERKLREAGKMDQYEDYEEKLA